jgi:hypothetical protein
MVEASISATARNNYMLDGTENNDVAFARQYSPSPTLTVSVQP